MTEPTYEIEARLTGLIESLAPGERRKLTRNIAKALRTSQASRIAAQQNPDGTAYAPRKPRLRKDKGKLRRTMFAKLRTAKYLKAEATPDSATVTFVAGVQHIARVHQYGLRDQLGKLMVRYPERQLLGATDQEAGGVLQKVMDQLSHR